MRVSQLERALVSYYSYVYERAEPSILRGMIKQYARADSNFDPDAFQDFVEETLLPEDDPELTDEIRRRVNEFTTPLKKRR